MARPNLPTSTFGIIACTALAVVLSGCGGQSDGGTPPTASPSASASPTASPTPTDPAEAAEQERIADALSRYEEYLEIDEKHQKAGTNGYEELALYLGDPDILSNERMKWDFLTEQGYKMVGNRDVTALVDASYVGDPLADTISGHRIKLDVCVDGTGTHTVDADGEVVPVPDPGPQKSISKVLMQGQPGERWTIREDKYTKKEC